MNRFDADTSVVRVGPDLFEGAMSRNWWVVRGPNGGYVAAVLLRALEQRLGRRRDGDGPGSVRRAGAVPGIKVDSGAKPMRCAPARR